MKAGRLIAFLLVFILKLPAQQDYLLDSLRHALNAHKHDTAKALTYISIGEIIYLGQPDSALKLWNDAKNICEKNLAGTLAPRSKVIFTKHLGAALLNIGVILQDRGRIPDALTNFFRSLRLTEEIGEKEGHANVNLSIGSVYAILRDTAKALKFYRSAVQEYETVDAPDGMAAALNNIGSIYNELNDYATSLVYYEKAMKIEEQIDDKMGLGFAYNSMGSIYLQLGQLDRAMQYFNKALSVQKEVDNRQGLCYTYNNMGTTFFRLKNFGEAEKYYLMSLEIAKEFNFPENIENSARELGGLYNSQRQFEKALAMHELYMQMRDTVNSQEARKAGIQKQIQYEYDKKAAADSIRNAERAIRENLKHEEEIKQQRIYTYGGIAGFALMLVIAGISFRAYKNKQKANIIITEQKQLVEEQKSMIEEKQKEIIDSITYARRIQRSLLPTSKYIDKNLERLKRN